MAHHSVATVYLGQLVSISPVSVIKLQMMAGLIAVDSHLITGI
jgi:hypothetical protein